MVKVYAGSGLLHKYPVHSLEEAGFVMIVVTSSNQPSKNNWSSSCFNHHLIRSHAMDSC